MKKLSVFIALVLLAAAGTGYAVTCAYDNVPGATLLVPYWRVSLNGATGAPIPSGGIDTLVSVVNVSTPGLIAHVTVWNKYSKAVLDFNIPLTGKDVVSFSMRDVMNGKLNANTNTQFVSATHPDPCGINTATGVYTPIIGFTPTRFIRFSNPEAPTGDAVASLSVYAPDAFAGFRGRVWDSLDESGDITSFTSSSGANILDTDNPVCFGSQNGDSVFKTDLSGYLTIDVVNYCTNFFPENPDFFDKDAIATAGWTVPAGCDLPNSIVACTQTFTPNALIGDIFYVDSAAVGGNISGDQAIALEFDQTLVFTDLSRKSFFGKFLFFQSNCPGDLERTSPAGCVVGTPGAAPFQFSGDGREALGNHYGFRYLSDSANGLQTWALIWRSDIYQDTAPDGTPLPTTPTINLCDWLAAGGPAGSGLTDLDHQFLAFVFDNDENSIVVGGGPSGNTPSGDVFVFLESQRINLLNNGQINPSGFRGGWIDATFVNPTVTGYNGGRNWNQAWVGVQHTAPGAILSVGHSASELSGQLNCSVPLVILGAKSAPVK